jgi:hypothetical protein
MKSQNTNKKEFIFGNVTTGLEHIFLHSAILRNVGSGPIFEDGGSID